MNQNSPIKISPTSSCLLSTRSNSVSQNTHTHRVKYTVRSTLSAALPVISFEHILKKFLGIRAKHDLKRSMYHSEVNLNILLNY